MNPGVEDAVRLAIAYGDKVGMVFGEMHIVLDDGNLEDESIAWCRDHSEDSDVHAVAAALLALTSAEREIVYSRVEAHYWLSPSSFAP